MPPTTTKTFLLRVEQELSRHGVLLESDGSLPSVATLIAGEPVRGSWLEHPRGRDLFEACKHLVGHPDVLQTRLVSGEVTYVHRELWPHVLSVATSGESWQRDELNEETAALWDRVESEGLVRLNGDGEAKTLATSVRKLEERLAIHSELTVGSAGQHAKTLRSWKRWRQAVRNASGLGGLPRPARARGLLETVLDGLNERFGSAGTLPWS